MKTIRLYGVSDDLIEIQGKTQADSIEGCDEYVARIKGITMGKWLISADEGTKQTRIRAFYDTDGTWSFAIGQVWGPGEAQAKEPAIFNVHFFYTAPIPDSDHSTMLEIEVPDDATVRQDVPQRVEA